MVVRLCFALCLVFAVVDSDAAAVKLATHADLVQTQQQVQKLENALAVQQDRLQTSLDANDKRISDFGELATMQGTHTAWVGNLVAMTSIGITILVFVAGLVTFLGATAKAKIEARDAAREWFNAETTRLRETIQAMEHEVETARATVVKVQQEAETEISRHTGDVKNMARTARDELDMLMRSMSKPGEVDPATASLVRSASAELKTRPESAYTAMDHYVRGVALFTDGKWQSALDAFNEAIGLGVTEPPHSQGTYLFGKGVVLGMLGKVDDEIAAYDLLYERYGENDTPGMREQVAAALLNKGVALGKLNKVDEAIAIYDAIDKRYGNNETAAIRKQVSSALVNKGIVLGKLGNVEKEVAVYEAVDERFGRDEAPEVREVVTSALVYKGNVLGGIGKNEEEIAVYDALDERYGKDGTPRILERLALSLLNKGIALYRLERFEEATVAFDMVERRYGGNEALEVRVHVARALATKGIVLGRLGKHEEAIDVFDTVVNRYVKDDASGMREQVARALVSKGIMLNHLGKQDMAIAAYDAIEELYGRDEAPAVREQVGKALVNKGKALSDLGKFAEAIPVYEAVETRYGNDEAPGARELVPLALNGLGFTQIMLAKGNWGDEKSRKTLLNDASRSLERALARCAPEMRSMTAGNIGYCHFLNGRAEEAKKYTDECLQLGGKDALALQQADSQVFRLDPEDRLYEFLLDSIATSVVPELANTRRENK